MHAWVLMDNHYHLVIETPEANLLAGMQWLQTTYTKRFNLRNRQWGHLFGGRYKAIVVQHQEGPSFRRLVDYLHLELVRAGLVGKGEGSEAYRWSNLRETRKPPSKRFEWMETRRSMDRLQIKDTPAGRRNYLERLEALTDWSKSNEAGRVLWEGQSLQSTLKRGWYFGEQAFRDRLLEMVKNRNQDNPKSPSRSIARDFRQGKDDEVGHKIIEAGLEYFDLSQNDLPSLRKGDERKSIIAGLITENTNLPSNGSPRISTRNQPVKRAALRYEPINSQ